MRLVVPLSIVLLASAGLPAGAFAQDGEQRTVPRCLIEVEGKVWQDGGPCWYSAIDEAGSFSVGGKGGASAFAYVLLDDELGTHGYWNGTQLARHAHDPLGELEHDGACWVNETSKVCAWQ